MSRHRRYARDSRGRFASTGGSGKKPSSKTDRMGGTILSSRNSGSRGKMSKRVYGANGKSVTITARYDDNKLSSTRSASKRLDRLAKKAARWKSMRGTSVRTANSGLKTQKRLIRKFK